MRRRFTEPSRTGAWDPDPGSVDAPGMVEGGDTLWLDERTLAVGRGTARMSDGYPAVADMMAETRRRGARVTICRTGMARASACI